MTESSQDRADADARRPPVETMSALPSYTKDFLGSLRPEEIETIRALSRLDPEEKVQLFEALKLTRSLQTTGRFVKWTFLGLIGIFVAFNMLAEQVGKLAAWFSHGVVK